LKKGKENVQESSGDHDCGKQADHDTKHERQGEAFYNRCSKSAPEPKKN
jgi:hypothetical protein